MKTAFPGMDPYLDHPALWTGLHNGLIACLVAQLQPLLEPRYVATMEERVYVEGPDQQPIPDIWVQKTGHRGGGTAVAVTDLDDPVILDVNDVEVREWYINIVDRYQAMKVVTVIEVVSPANKAAGPGRDSYQHKQQEILASKSHLIEIDLLRHGGHVLSVPHARLETLGDYDYLICVNRWPLRRRFELYSWLLRRPMRTFRLPLVAPDKDIRVPLQEVFEQAYQNGRYHLRVQYEENCIPPLESADQEWANQQWIKYKEAHPELFS